MRNQSITEKTETGYEINSYEVNTYLNFMVKNDSYGLESTHIREVIEFSQINYLTRIPTVHESILGIINLRGEIIPVIDLSMRMYNSKINITMDTCIIVIDISDEDEIVTLAAMVDKVNGVINISKKDISAIPDFGAKIPFEFIDNIGKTGDEFIVLLNIKELLNTNDISNITVIDTEANKFISIDKNIQDLEITSDSKGKEIKEKEAGDIHNFVILSIGEEKYGIDIVHIHEIINISHMTHMPNVQPFMKGVINLNNKLIPVVDMRTRCNLETKEYTKKTLILIVKLDDLLIGLVVDSILNIVKFPIKKIQYPLHYSAKIDSDFINGLFEYNGKVIILLDVKKILSPEEYNLIESKDFTIQE